MLDKIKYLRKVFEMSQAKNLMADNDIQLTLKKLEVAPVITQQHLNSIAEMVTSYFNNGRPKIFKKYKNRISQIYGKLAKHLSIDDLVRFTENYFLLRYTLIDDWLIEQEEIYKNIAIPYLEIVSASNALGLPKKLTQPMCIKVCFICRHAVTNGPYAPGKSIYTYAKILAKAKYQVVIYFTGQIDNEFFEMCQTMGIKVEKLKDGKISQQINFFRERVAKGDIDTILTEIEFGIPSVLSIMGVGVEVNYLAPGYYYLPWYDKLILSSTLEMEKLRFRENESHIIPTFVDEMLLSRAEDRFQTRIIRSRLGATEKKIVIGMFARHEKFSNEYLDLCIDILKFDPNILVLLAGPGDQKATIQYLEEWVLNRRAFVLGPVDVNVWGYVLDIGLDTFPVASGFSVMELAAKGIPIVVSMNDTIRGNIQLRDENLLFSSQNEIFDFIGRWRESAAIRENSMAGSKRIIRQAENEEEFLGVLRKIFH